MNLIVIAGTHSGVGKTTVTAGILAALRRRGLRVEAFKAGPDYIDPSYLSEAAGRPCHNLDTWLLSPDAIRELVARRAPHTDFAIVEGMMGLFDGRSGDDESGSVADLARLLDAPVLLVVDVDAMARSAAAVVLGYQQFDRRLKLAGVILNRAAGPEHVEMTARPIREATSLPVLGHLPTDERLRLPERHLGLVPAQETPPPPGFLSSLAALVEQTMDLSLLMKLSVPFVWSGTPNLFPTELQEPRARIAVAVDRAFGFYYQDSLDLLEAWGAELAPFSPMSDPELPLDVGAVYLGGGFPELYARELAENEAMKSALREAHRRGVRVYGECGGLMYLGRSLCDADGQLFRMADVVPLGSDMQARHLTLGYREARVLGDSPLLAAGETIRGHEFHWSSQVSAAPDHARAAYEFLDGSGRTEGYAGLNVFASYLHLHLASDRRLAPNFVTSAASLYERSK